MPVTRANPSSPPTAAATPPPPAAAAAAETSEPATPSRATAVFIPASRALVDLPCFSTEGALGATPTIDLSKVMWADGSSAAEGDRCVAAYQASSLVQKVPPHPGAANFLAVLEESAKVERSRGVGSVAFRAASAKKVLVKHCLSVLHAHGLLLESAGSVLLHGADELQPGAPRHVGLAGSAPATSTSPAPRSVPVGAGSAVRPTVTAGGGASVPAVDLTGAGGSSSAGAQPGKGSGNGAKPEGMDAFFSMLENPSRGTESLEEVRAPGLAMMRPILRCARL